MKETFETRGVKDHDMVAEIKQRASDLEDAILKVLHVQSDCTVVGAEAPRLVSLARTHLETSVMFAVKAVSRK